MSNTLSRPPTDNRKRFTRKECEFLEQNGLLTGRYELIDGEIFFKMTQNPPHRLTVMLIGEWLRQIFGGLYVAVQSPIDVAPDDSEINLPEPDIAVQSESAVAYATRLPGPADILLVVEISDSTLRFDLSNKAALYARAGIAEYWVADISGRRFIVHRNPGIADTQMIPGTTQEGKEKISGTENAAGYAEVTEYAEMDTLSLLTRPDTRVRVSELLPPKQS